LSFENYEQLLDQPSMYTINGTQYLLVEWPSIYTGSVVETALRRLLGAGIRQLSLIRSAIRCCGISSG
jgi:tyrosine-protein phosphatase YwqE